MHDGAAGGGDWRALLERASAYRREGRTEQAVAAYEALLRINPDLPDSWYNLGWLRRQSRDFDGALDAYGEALSRGVGGPEEVHVNRAVIFLEHLHRFDEAAAELQAALAVAPDYLPALINLGNLHEDRGNRADARAAYARALELESGHTLALARLAGVTEPDGSDDPIIRRVQSALTNPAIDLAEQADLGFALGRLLDRVGAYHAAFVAYAAANDASRASLGPRFSGYQPEAAERFIDALIAAFPAATPLAAPGGRSDRTPLFICGLFRSGSTLVEQILAAHSGVAAGGELDLIPEFVRRLQPYPAAAAAATPAVLESLRSEYARATAAIAPDKAVLTDKRPDNFLHIGLIKRLFPTARILHTRRDPLDNILSLYFLHLNPSMSYALKLEDAAHWYGQYQRLMAHWEALYGGDILDVDYETLVRDPQPVIAEALRFAGLDWDEACLAHQRATGPVRTASVWQVREPIHQRSSGRWRNYEAQLSGVRALFSGRWSG